MHLRLTPLLALLSLLLCCTNPAIRKEQQQRKELQARLRALSLQLQSPQWQQRALAAKELGRIGTPAKSTVKDLTKAMYDRRSGPVRKHARWALIQIGSPSIKPLLQAYNDNSWQRSLALSTLAQIGASHPKPLLHALQSTKSQIRRAAALTIARCNPIPPEAIPPLQKTLQDPQPKVQSAALYSLRTAAIQQRTHNPKRTREIATSIATLLSTNHAKIPALRALSRLRKYAHHTAPTIRPLVKDTNPKVQRHALLTLGHIKAHDPDTIKLMLSLLRNPQNNLAYAAYQSLQNLGPLAKSAIPTLLQYLKQPGTKNSTQQRTIRIIGSIGPAAKDAIPLLIPLLLHSSSSLRYNSANALKRLGPTAVPHLHNALRNATSTLHKTYIVHALTRLAHHITKPAPELEACFDHTNARLRSATRELLLKIGPPAVPIAVRVLKHTQDPNRKLYPLDVLRRHAKGSHTAANAVIPLLSTKQRRLLTVVLQTIATIGPPAVKSLPALQSILRSSNNAYIRSHTAKAIGHIRPKAKDALPLLLKTLNTKIPPHLTAALITAIGNIGPSAKEAIPTLQPFLKHRHTRIHRHTIIALAKLSPPPPIVKQILKALHHRYTSIQHAAVVAVEHLGPLAKDAIPTLKTLLLARSTPWRTKMRIVQTLRSLGPLAKDAIPTLKTLLQSQSKSLRQNAQNAIQHIQRSTP